MKESVERKELNSSTSKHSYLLFDVAGLCFATPAVHVQHIHDSLKIEPLQGTLHWFCGLAVAHGKILPVTDLGALLGKPASEGYVLQLHGDIGVAGIRVAQILGLGEHVVMVDEPDTSIPDVLSPGLDDRCIDFKGRRYRVLDFRTLLQAPQLLSIAHES